MINDYKIIDLNGYRFQLNRMTPLIGSRIVSVLMSAAFKLQEGRVEEEGEQESRAAFDSLSPEEKANSSISAMWIGTASILAPAIYEQIQRHCLDVCQLVVQEGAPPIPVLVGNGRWADKQLGRDTLTVSQLIVESLQFNLAPFFTGSASKTAGTAQAPEPDTNPPAYPPVTATSSAR